MVFQSASVAFNPRLSVRAILNEPLALLGSHSTAGQPTELLDMVGLPHSLLSKRPAELSGGQRQRVGIARALAVRPKLLICDEAVSALDVSVQAQVLNLLSDLQNSEGLAMLFITHDLSVVSYLADRIAVMNRGRIVEIGDSLDVLDQPRDSYTRELLASSTR
ncbi:ATP-binding cassette domain-containing protein [Rhizobium sp. BE258]|uniref:ATP-binding cassette domain-containing protein n=1 Tax=Rhizobium sp. BE258 TaxID=2817722 RepID=UPI000DD50E8C